jgi:hypothetical protein
MSKDAPAAPEPPKALAIVREPFTSEGGTAFAKGEAITDRAVLREIRGGAHADFVLLLHPKA